jgi:hypothetical protein
MGLPKQLSEQQKKFAELLVYNEGRKTPTECAIESGYAEGSAHVRASELRNPNKFPLVAKYIGELRAEMQKKYEVTSPLKDTLLNLVGLGSKPYQRVHLVLRPTLRSREVKQQDYTSNKK